MAHRGLTRLSRTLRPAGQADLATRGYGYKEEARPDGIRLGAEHQVEVAAASVEVRKVELESAHSSLESVERLAAKNVLSQEEVGSKRSRVASAEATLKQAKAEFAVARSKLRAVELELDSFHIKAPVSGTVIARQSRPGEYATPSQPVIVLEVLEE